jgi:hypothetical protein
VKKTIISMCAVLALAALGMSPAGAESITNKLKSKKVQGDLVPAYDGDSNTFLGGAVKKTVDTDGDQHCLVDTSKQCFCENAGSAPTGQGICSLGLIPCTSDADCTAFAGDFCSKTCRTNDDCGGGEACCGNDFCTNIDAGNFCEFEKGTFKTQVGGTTQFQLTKASCGIGTSMCSKNGKPCSVPADCTATDGTCTNKGVLLPDPAHMDATSPLQKFAVKYCLSTGAPCSSDNHCADIGHPIIPGDCQPTKRTLLCAEQTILSSIMDQERADDGTLTPKTCFQGTNIEGKSNYVVATVGYLSCKSGTCKAVLGNNAGGDPCPDVDKVNEVRRMTVMDGPVVGSANVLGNTLRACCEPDAHAVGGSGGKIECGNINQDVLGEMGTVVQGVAP